MAGCVLSPCCYQVLSTERDRFYKTAEIYSSQIWDLMDLS